MFAGFVDHLWQSAWFAGPYAAGAAFRDNFAALRLWLWRIAALKFAVPVFIAGRVRWMAGISVKYPGDPAPAGSSMALAR